MKSNILVNISTFIGIFLFINVKNVFCRLLTCRICVFACVFALTVPAMAQHQSAYLIAGKQAAHLSFDANLIFNLNAGYMRKLESVQVAQAPVAVWAQFRKALFTSGGLNADIQVGTTSQLTLYNRWKSLNGVSIVASQASNLNGDFWAWGGQLEALPGYYGEKWAYALALAYAYKPGIHLTHSDYAASAFQGRYAGESGPPNGWFYQDFHQLRIGGSVTRTWARWQGNLSAGTYYYPNRLDLFLFPDIGVLPFYITLNVARAW
jgi:hypothetical protein